MNKTILKAASLGAALGVAGCVVMFLTRWTFSHDWLLALIILFCNITAFSVAAWYGVNPFGVCLAGVAGMGILGWIGVHTIGAYEYTVPTPQQEREIKILSKGQERSIELKSVPEETVKRIPIGACLGMNLGFLIGCIVYSRSMRLSQKDVINEDDVFEPEGKPLSNPNDL